MLMEKLWRKLLISFGGYSRMMSIEIESSQDFYYNLIFSHIAFYIMVPNMICGRSLNHDFFGYLFEFLVLVRRRTLDPALPGYTPSAKCFISSETPKYRCQKIFKNKLRRSDQKISFLIHTKI